MRIENTNDVVEASDAVLLGSSLQNVNMAATSFAQFNLSRAKFEDGTMPGVMFINANLAGAGFDDVSLVGATMRNANLTGLNIAGCRMDRMRIEGVLVTELLAAWKERT